MAEKKVTKKKVVTKKKTVSKVLQKKQIDDDFIDVMPDEPKKPVERPEGQNEILAYENISQMKILVGRHCFLPQQITRLASKKISELNKKKIAKLIEFGSLRAV